MGANGNLSVKQARFLQARLAGHNVIAAANIAGISETQAHRWLKQEVFKEAYKQASDELFESALGELKVSMNEAIDGLLKHIRADVEPTAASQMAAIRTWIESGINIHKMAELEEKIAALEQLLKEPRGTQWKVIS